MWFTCVKQRKTKRERVCVFRSWSGPKAWLIVPEHVDFVYNSVLGCIQTHKLDRCVHVRERMCVCAFASVCVCIDHSIPTAGSLSS